MHPLTLFFQHLARKTADHRLVVDQSQGFQLSLIIFIFISIFHLHFHPHFHFNLHLQPAKFLESDETKHRSGRLSEGQRPGEAAFGLSRASDAQERLESNQARATEEPIQKEAQV